jgi:hypothetical protein
MAVQEVLSFDALSNRVMQRALEMNFNKTSGQLVMPAAVIMAAAQLTFYSVGFHEVSNKLLKDLEDRLKALNKHIQMHFFVCSSCRRLYDGGNTAIIFQMHC